MIYADIRNLQLMGVVVTGDSALDVSRVLDRRENYDELLKFALAAFRRRNEVVAMQ